MLGPLTYGVLSQVTAVAPWTPASPTTGGGVSPHTWKVPGVGNFQDAAKTTVAALTDPVGAVVNQGSDTYDVTQATAGNRPTLQQVTIGSVTSYVWLLDGTNDYLLGAFGGGAISQPLTIFSVGQLDVTAVNDNTFRHLLAGSADTNAPLIRQRSVTSPDSWEIRSGTPLVGGDSDGNWNIWTVLFNGASSQFWLNGVSETTGNAGSTGMDGLTIGGQAVNGQLPWKGDIGQILIYASNLSNADKNQVGEYLASVTGISWSTIT
jgi:hypothetical protein